MGAAGAGQEGEATAEALLIALQLALDLLRDVCVLEMLLRDRATGTNLHRQGGTGNDFVARLDGQRAPYTREGILDTVEQCAVLFDALAARWWGGYREQRFPLLAAVGRARG